jgi:hypothetical protein
LLETWRGWWRAGAWPFLDADRTPRITSRRGGLGIHTGSTRERLSVECKRVLVRRAGGVTSSLSQGCVSECAAGRWRLIKASRLRLSLVSHGDVGNVQEGAPTEMPRLDQLEVRLARIARVRSGSTCWGDRVSLWSAGGCGGCRLVQHAVNLDECNSSSCFFWPSGVAARV